MLSILANVKKISGQRVGSTKLPSHYSLRDLTVILPWSSFSSDRKDALFNDGENITTRDAPVIIIRINFLPFQPSNLNTFSKRV